MLDEIIRESWAYKQWRQETIAKVTKQVTQQVTQQIMKQNIISVVQAKFPSLLELTQERLELLKTPQRLQKLLVQIAQAQDEESGRRILLVKGKSSHNLPIS